MAYYAYSGWGHFRPLDTRSSSGEATDVKDTVLCFHSYMFHVPSFSKGTILRSLLWNHRGIFP